MNALKRIKINNIAWLILIAAAAYGLYTVKYRVLNIQRDIASIEKEIQQEQENLHVVAAEWAYLTRPDRLQALAEKNTHLTAVQGMQVVSVNNIAFPPAPDTTPNSIPVSNVIPASTKATPTASLLVED